MSLQRSLGRRIWKRLRDLGLGLGLERERCQGEATAQRGLVSKKEGRERERERGLVLVKWLSGQRHFLTRLTTWILSLGSSW